MTLRVAVFGVGRLGKEIVALAPDRDASIVATFSRASGSIEDALRSARADVAIDVSVAGEVVPHAALCARLGVPVVIGVTGWDENFVLLAKTVTDAGGSALVAPNFSVGATLFSVVVSDVARRFSRAFGFDAAIIETHHALKKDAPSGTARALAAVAHRSRGAEVPITSVRVGHVPGEHTLVLDAPFEQVRLTHEARDRRVFADGALLAARWLAARPAGMYTMVDVVRELTGES